MECLKIVQIFKSSSSLLLLTSLSSLHRTLTFHFFAKRKKGREEKKKEEETKRTQRLPRPLHPVPFSLDVRNVLADRRVRFSTASSLKQYTPDAVSFETILFKYSMKARSLYYFS